MGDLSILQPATQGRVVTPDDDEDLAFISRLIYVGTGGDLEVILREDSAAIVIPGVPDGAMLPLQAKRILDGNTTATGIVVFR